MGSNKHAEDEGNEVDEQGFRIKLDAEEASDEASEVDEQGARVRFRDEEADEEASKDEEEDSDVDEQRFHFSDVTLKREIAPISFPIALLS